MPIVVLLLSNYITMTGMGFVVPFLPIYARELGASGFDLGILVAGFSLAMGLCQPFAGSLSDKYGRKKFLMTGLAIFSTCGFAYTISESVIDITLVRFVQGFGAGMVFPVAMAYMADWTPATYEGRYMGIFHISLMAGFGSGPVFGGILNDAFGTQTAFLAMGISAFVSLVLILLFLPESQHGEENKKEVHSVFKVFFHILKQSRMRGVLIVRVAIMLAMVPSFIFLPVMMTENMGASGTIIGVAIAIRVLITALLQIPCGIIAHRYNRVYITLISIFLVAITVSFYGFTETTWQLIGTFILLGICEAAFLPTTTAIAMESGESYGMGATMGVFNTAQTMGMFIGSIVGGLLIDMYGFGQAFLMLGCTVGFFSIVGAKVLLKTPTTLIQQKLS